MYSTLYSSCVYILRRNYIGVRTCGHYRIPLSFCASSRSRIVQEHTGSTKSTMLAREVGEWVVVRYLLRSASGPALSRRISSLRHPCNRCFSDMAEYTSVAMSFARQSVYMSDVGLHVRYNQQCRLMEQMG
jgi:hypothetical protein